MSKRELIEITLSQLKPHSNPDVICFTETFVRAGQERNIYLTNYELAASYNRVNIKRGGTCIFVRAGIPNSKVHCIDTLAKDNHFECCSSNIIALNIIIICVYRIPSKYIGELDDFFKRLELLLYTCTHKYPKKKLIICGDLNINLLERSRAQTRLRQIVDSNGLIFHINVPTRGRSCIDHIISNVENASGSVLPLFLSDHDTAQSSR